MLINPMLSPGSSWVGQHGHPGGLVVGQSRLPVGCLLSSFTDKGDGHVTTKDREGGRIADPGCFMS